MIKTLYMDILVNDVPQNRVSVLWIENDEYAGHLSLDIKDSIAAISWLYVKPEYRHKQIGSKLLQHSFEIAEANDVSVINLSVDYSSKQNNLIKYYKYFDFRVTYVYDDKSVMMSKFINGSEKEFGSPNCGDSGSDLATHTIEE